MEKILILSEIIFYLTVSTAIVIISIINLLVACRFVRILQEIRKIFRNIYDITDETSNQITNIINKFSRMPIFSYFFKQSKYSERKGRQKPKNNPL